MEVFTKTKWIQYAIQITYLGKYVEIKYEEAREIKIINIPVEDILIIYDNLAE